MTETTQKSKTTKKEENPYMAAIFNNIQAWLDESEEGEAAAQPTVESEAAAQPTAENSSFEILPLYDYDAKFKMNDLISDDDDPHIKKLGIRVLGFLLKADIFITDTYKSLDVAVKKKN